jgi:hypothetical protein
MRHRAIQVPGAISRIAVALVLSIAAATLIAAALESLKWRYVHDSPLMIYAGFLLAGGAVPYRDFFDMNMPGTYFVMLAMGRIFGWDDLGFRAFDLLCLASISVSTFLWMRRFGNLPAFAASVAFPLWYLNAGPSMSLQREYIALIPFAGTLAIAMPPTSDSKPGLRVFLTGFLTGVTMLIKPQYFIMYLPPMIILMQDSTASVSRRRLEAALLGGMLLPLGATFLYLVRSGALKPFLDIAVNYWPLYAQMTGWHQPISGLDRLAYVVRSTRDGLMTFYLPFAVVGLGVLCSDHTQRRYASVLAALLGAAAIYPALSGQFWAYHWIPFRYMALCVASLAVREVPIKTWSLAGVAPIVAATFLLLSLSSISPGWPGQGFRGGGAANLPKGGVPDEVAQFLRSHMRSGDVVQPLDWTGGAVHGMLIARAPLATRFMYDFHFYHHISSPYIQGLRREFMKEITAAKPRFIIQVFENKPWPVGADTTRDFPELKSFLEQHYFTAQTGHTYRILQRNEEMHNNQVGAAR